MEDQLRVIEGIAGALATPEHRQALEDAVREIRRGGAQAEGLEAAIADAEQVTRTGRAGSASGVGSSQPDVLWLRVLALATAQQARPLDLATIEGGMGELVPSPGWDAEALGSKIGEGLAAELRPIVERIGDDWLRRLVEAVQDLAERPGLNSLVRKAPSEGTEAAPAAPAKPSAKPRTARSG